MEFSIHTNLFSAEEEEGMLIFANIQMDNSGKLLPKT
jgi:hypothetical protein